MATITATCGAAAIFDDFTRVGFVTDPGPEWRQTVLNYDRPEIRIGGILEDPVDWSFGPDGYHAYSEVTHETPLGQNQFLEIEIDDFVNTIGLGNAAMYVYYRTTIDGAVGYYLYLVPEKAVDDGLSAGLYNWNGASGLSHEDQLTIPGSMPNGMKIRLEAINDVIYTFYDIGAGWVELLTPVVESTNPNSPHVGVGFEGFTEQAKAGITSFEAGDLGAFITRLSAAGTAKIIHKAAKAEWVLRLFDDFERPGPELGADWIQPEFDPPNNEYSIENGAVRTSRAFLEYDDALWRGIGHAVSTIKLGNDQRIDLEITGYIDGSNEPVAEGEPWYWIDIYPHVRWSVDADGDYTDYYLYVSPDSENTIYVGLAKWRKNSPPVTQFGAYDSYPTVIGEFPDGLKVRIDAVGNVISGYLQRPGSDVWELMSQGTDVQGDALTSGTAGFAGWDISDFLKKDVAAVWLYDTDISIPNILISGNAAIVKNAAVNDSQWVDHIFDDFNRPGPEVGNEWEQVRDNWALPIIYDETVVSDAAWTEDPFYRNWAHTVYNRVLYGDQYVEMEVADYQNDGVFWDVNGGLTMCTTGYGTNAHSYYYLYVSPDIPANNMCEFGLVRWDLASPPVQSLPGSPGSYQFTIPGSFPVGMKLRMEKVGNVISAYYNIGAGYVLVAQGTDANYQFGKPGMFIENWDTGKYAAYDNFKAGDLITSVRAPQIGGTVYLNAGDVAHDDDVVGYVIDWSANAYVV